MILFALLAAGSVLLAYLLPETFGKRPPEIIAELMPEENKSSEMKEKEQYQSMV